MQKAVEVVENRIKELEHVVKMTKLKNSFTAQARLVEAKKILELLKSAYVCP